MATISFPVTVTSVSLDFAHPLTILSWSEALNLDDLWEERAARGLERKDGLHQPAPARPIGNRQRGDHTPIVQGESRGREIEPHVSPAHDGKTHDQKTGTAVDRVYSGLVPVRSWPVSSSRQVSDSF